MRHLVRTLQSHQPQQRAPAQVLVSRPSDQLCQGKIAFQHFGIRVQEHMGRVGPQDQLVQAAFALGSALMLQLALDRVDLDGHDLLAQIARALCNQFFDLVVGLRQLLRQLPVPVTRMVKFDILHFRALLFNRIHMAWQNAQDRKHDGKHDEGDEDLVAKMHLLAGHVQRGNRGPECQREDHTENQKIRAAWHIDRDVFAPVQIDNREDQQDIRARHQQIRQCMRQQVRRLQGRSLQAEHTRILPTRDIHIKPPKAHTANYV